MVVTWQRRPKKSWIDTTEHGSSRWPGPSNNNTIVLGFHRQETVWQRRQRHFLCNKMWARERRIELDDLRLVGWTRDKD